MQSRMFRINSALACASLAFSLASATVEADSLHVTVASASNNNAYDLSFAPPGGTASSPLVTPLSSPYSSVRSIIYVGNESTKVTDLIAADYTGSRIVRYAGAAGTANLIWAYAPATPGPRYPEGLAADGSGNLYANRGDIGHPQVWVFKSAAPAGSAYASPVLMADSPSIAGYGKVRLLDALIVPAGTPGGLSAGDLLVLVSDGRVLRYPAANIKTFLGGGSVGSPITLVAAAQCPLGQTPTGMTLWPADGSLLVATVGGTVLNYSLTATGATLKPAFATGLGLSLGKIRSFLRPGTRDPLTGLTSAPTPYAVFDQPIRGKIFEFGAPPTGGCPKLTMVCNAPLAVITTVSSPVGLAATDVGTPSSACDINLNPNGCSLLGGAIVIQETNHPPGSTLLVTSCAVDSDPRSNSLGVCDENNVGALLGHSGDDHLYADDVCPGYPHTMVPAYLCGASGASGRGFTIAKVSQSSGYTNGAPLDLLVTSDLTPAGSAPTCPQLADGWAPLAGEGSIVEGNQFIELVGGCDGGVGHKPGASLDIFGTQLNDSTLADPTNWLVALANQKFTNLSNTINNLSVPASITQANKDQLSNCVATAEAFMANAAYQCAAHQAWTCDNNIAGNANPIISNSSQLSSYSEIRGRLENLVMHLATRTLHLQPASATLPPPDPGVPAGGCTSSTPPDPPTGLTASVDYNGLVELEWYTSDSGSPPVQGYNIFMSRDNATGTYSQPGPFGPAVNIGSVSASTDAAQSTSITPSPVPQCFEWLRFYLVAYDSASSSEPSTTADAYVACPL